MNTFVYSIGIAVITTLVCLLLGASGGVYPEPEAIQHLTHHGGAVHPPHVGEYLDTYACHSGAVRLPEPAAGRRCPVFGMIHNFLPFMIYPIYNTLQKMDHNLIEAAQDLEPLLPAYSTR